MQTSVVAANATKRTPSSGSLTNPNLSNSQNNPNNNPNNNNNNNNNSQNNSSNNKADRQSSPTNLLEIRNVNSGPTTPIQTTLGNTSGAATKGGNNNINRNNSNKYGSFPSGPKISSLNSSRRNSLSPGANALSPLAQPSPLFGLTGSHRRPSDVAAADSQVALELARKQQQASSEVERFLLKWSFLFYSLLVALPLLVVHGINMTDYSNLPAETGAAIVLTFSAALFVVWIAGSIFSMFINPSYVEIANNAQFLLCVLIAISQIAVFMIGFWSQHFRMSAFTIEILLLFSCTYGEKINVMLKISHKILAITFIILLVTRLPNADAGLIAALDQNSGEFIYLHYIITSITITLCAVFVWRLTNDLSSNTRNSLTALEITVALSRYDTAQARATLGLPPASFRNNQQTESVQLGLTPGSGRSFSRPGSVVNMGGQNQAAASGNNNLVNNNNNNEQNNNNNENVQDNLLFNEFNKVITLLERIRPHVPDWALIAAGAKTGGGVLNGSLNGASDADLDDGEDTESSIVLSESGGNQSSFMFREENSFGGNISTTSTKLMSDVGASGGAIEKDVHGKISVVVLNYNLDNAAPTPEYSEHKFVERVNAVARSLHGVAHHFVGSHAVVSWNAIRHTAAPESKAARFMHTMNTFSGDAHVTVSGVAMTGRARCHLAGDRNKHVVLSATWWPMLMHLATVAKARNSLLIDGPTKTAVFYEYNLRGFSMFEFVKNHRVTSSSNHSNNNNNNNISGHPNGSKRGFGGFVESATNSSTDTVNDNNDRHSFDKRSNSQSGTVEDGTIDGVLPGSVASPLADPSHHQNTVSNASDSQLLSGGWGGGGSFFQKGQSVMVFELIGERHQDNVEWLFIYQRATSSDNTVRDIDALSCVALELAGQHKYNEAMKILKRVHSLNAPGQEKDGDNFSKPTFELCKMMLDRLVITSKDDGDDLVDGVNFSIKVGYL